MSATWPCSVCGQEHAQWCEEAQANYNSPAFLKVAASRPLAPQYVAALAARAEDSVTRRLAAQLLLAELRLAQRGPQLVRPPWESLHPGGYVACSCGEVLQSVRAVREHWQLGHFDRLKPPGTIEP